MMFKKIKKKLAHVYAKWVLKVAPLYQLTSKSRGQSPDVTGPRRVVLLISRPMDIELLIGLHEKARKRRNLNLSFWVVDKCAGRYPEVIDQLKEKGAVVEEVVSFGNLAKIRKKLKQVDVFLSTVESTVARDKLPYIITCLANLLGVSTFTLQHGFPNLGLSYCDHVYGTEIRFAAKTVLTWGPVEALPSWVSDETRRKCVGVGCPKELVLFKNDLSRAASDRPIIAIFENLHGHIFGSQYISSFLSHLQETANRHKEFRFILKPHPSSLRRRTDELSERLNRLEDVEIIGRVDGDTPAYTTPWLLANAAAAITTPSTIALDGALQGIPVALALYGLDLYRSIYSPLVMLETRDDWDTFLGKLKFGDDLKNRNETFLGRVIVPGDAASRILDLMAAA